MVLAAKTEQEASGAGLRRDIQPGNGFPPALMSPASTALSAGPGLAQTPAMAGSGLTHSLRSPVHKNLRHRREDAGREVLPREGHRPGLRPAGETCGQTDL